MARPTDRRRGRAVGDYTTSRTATFRVRSPGGNLSWFLSRQDVHVVITRGGRTACVRACVVCAPRPAEAHFLNTFQRSCWFFQRATTIYFFGHRQIVEPTSPSTHNRCHLRHTTLFVVAMAPKRLTVGWPIDFSADVPILPPFALLLTFLSSLVMWFVTKMRLRWLAWPIDSKWVRIAAFVGAASVVASVADAASKALDEAGSGVNFTEVTGLAVDFPFDGTRNPMYAVLLFVATPALAMLIDSAWPFVFLPLLYAYISDIVIVAEEKLLLETFGKAYATYAKETPRLSVTGVWRAKDED
jgi:protein-S-isoprenylcysteine O-methyltransferase Ste14